MEPPSLNVNVRGECYTPLRCDSPQGMLTPIGPLKRMFAGKNALLLAWNCLSVLAVGWLVLSFWKFIFFVAAMGGVGFTLLTIIGRPVLTFAMKTTGLVKNNGFMVLPSWRGVSTRSMELSEKVRRCCC